MITNKKQIIFSSTSGLSDIFAEAYYPDENTVKKGVIQIAHGMAEHHERYEDFIEFLINNGFVVYINDHLGHGKSVTSNNELGYFGKETGYKYLVKDMKKLSKIAKEENPDLPFILFGHSMGSMLARLYTENYGNLLDGVIYCGTTGPYSAAGIGTALTKAISKLKGDHYRSELINKLAFGTYNNKFKPQRTSFDWLTTDNDIVDKYIADPYCGFLFTANGYRDLMTLISVISRPDWYTSIPSDLPIYIISGKDDPVGAYGKGITTVYNGLYESKHDKVSMKLYEGMRHEILNEHAKQDVYNDILTWISSVI
ncbi:MAG: alpha/beta hydrolase [Clostridia bacterium]|nr:alpha/beta hydrolase [Clostridia bacterium]